MVTLLFLLWFKIQQPQNMSQRQLYEVWKRETQEAPKVIKPETVKGLYKVSGRREIVLIADFESHQALDEALSQLLFTKEIGHSFPGVTALPTSFVVDREGRVVQKHVGLLNPVTTEQETRALAGLTVNASIEQVDRFQPGKLENAAQATTIPGVDLASLSADRRTSAIQKLNAEPCTCGCDLTVAKCRIDDPNCSISLPLARRIVQQIAEKR